ncbi:MAG: ribbon-helix-helix domain-containing protein [Thermoproteus sp.]|jgi:transcriptional regulator, CopG family
MTREIEIERCIKTSDGEEVCFPLSVIVEDRRENVPVERDDVKREQDVGKRRERREPMELISVHLPRAMLVALDDMVRKGIYPNRSEAIRDALAKLLAQYKDVLRREGQ